MTEDFSNMPISINEIKATTNRNGCMWTPRDALIDMLRNIDSGKLNPTRLIIVYSMPLDAEHNRTGYVQAGCSDIEFAGLLSLTMLNIR